MIVLQAKNKMAHIKFSSRWRLINEEQLIHDNKFKFVGRLTIKFVKEVIGKKPVTTLRQRLLTLNHINVDL
jgi:hypothetical protein